MKGFGSIRNLVGLIIGLLLFISFYPYIQDQIDAAVPLMDPFTAAFLKLIPVTWLFIFMLFILAYLPGGGVRGERE